MIVNADRPVLERSRPRTSVIDFSPEEIHRFLTGRLRNRGLEAAYLFGSVAEGSAGPWSDLDVLIVKHTDAPFVERPREFLDLFDLGVAVDILVYTPEELEAQLRSGSGFWKLFAETRQQLL